MYAPRIFLLFITQGLPLPVPRSHSQTSKSHKCSTYPVCYTKDCPRQNIIICMLHLMTSVSCPDRPAHTRKDGLVLGPTIWEGPIRLQEFAYHANVTFKITCDSYLNPAPWARENAQFEITRSLHAHKHVSHDLKHIRKFLSLTGAGSGNETLS